MKKVIFECREEIEAYKVGDNLDNVLKMLENRFLELRDKLSSGRYVNVGFHGGLYYEEPEHKRAIAFGSKDKSIDDFMPSLQKLAVYEKNFYKSLKKNVHNLLEYHQVLSIDVSVLAEKFNGRG